MAHTFEIRFDRSEGLAALLEAPTNSFRWKGSGRLSIDAQGVSVAVKRGLLSLLARNRTRRIAAGDLKEVFRAGDSLRVEFSTDETTRVSLLFWARNRDVAAQIVQLLPTLRTVELEDNSAAGRFRFNWRTITLLVAAFTAMTFGVIALRNERVAGPASEPVAVPRTSSVSEPGVHVVEGQAATSRAPASTAPAKQPAADARTSPDSRVRETVIPVYSNPPASAPLSREAPELAPPWTELDAVAAATVARLANSQAVGPQTIVFRVRVSPDGVVPIVPGMASYAVARKQLDLFLLEARNAGDASSWWAVTVRIHNSWDLDDPALWPLRDAELAASRAWRNYYEFYYGSGLNDEAAELEFARMLTNRVRQYVD